MSDTANESVNQLPNGRFAEGNRLARGNPTSGSRRSQLRFKQAIRAELARNDNYREIAECVVSLAKEGNPTCLKFVAQSLEPNEGDEVAKFRRELAQMKKEINAKDAH